MARREALLKLHKRLVNRRDALLQALSGDLEDLSGFTDQRDLTGDAADAAFDADSTEITSQLAAFEARELAQIERALERLKQGTYGQCEECGKKILISRLNALPYSTLCIDCQREMEKDPYYYSSGGSSADWEKVFHNENSMTDRDRVDFSQLETE